MSLFTRRREGKIWKGSPLLLIFLVFLISPSLSAAVELAKIPGNIHIGPLKIHPGVSVKQEYRDNLFREANDEKGSAVTTFSPGIVFQLPFRRHFLQFDYHSDLIESSQYQRVYDTDSHFANLFLNLDLNRVNVLLGDNWASDSTPPDFKNDIRNNYNQNRLFCDTSYKLANRYKVTGFYRNSFRDFDSFRKPGQFDPELDNYTENDVGATLFYRFLPLTSALFEYGFTHINNTDKGLPTTDSDSHRIWLGLTWEATAKIVGTIKGGYVTRKYDGPSDDWDGFGLEGDLEYEISPYYSLSFNGFRKLLETTVTEFSVTGGPGVYGTFYVSTGASLSLTHRFTYKISALAEALYFNDDYRERGTIGRRRNDDRFGFGLGVTYQVQDWLGCKLSYRFLDNDSNIDVEDYRENIISGTVLLTF